MEYNDFLLRIVVAFEFTQSWHGMSLKGGSHTNTFALILFSIHVYCTGAAESWRSHLCIRLGGSAQVTLFKTLYGIFEAQLYSLARPGEADPDLSFSFTESESESGSKNSGNKY